MHINGKEIKLIVGLGNPSPKFSNTRHNIGIEVAKLISHKIEKSEKPQKRNIDFAHLRMFSNITILFPAVFMNQSGKAVKESLEALRIKPKELLVIHDDLETPCGMWKFKEEGSASGHNGLKSIIDQIGTNEFLRLKLGIARPVSRDPETIGHYVLAKIPQNEKEKIMQAAEEAASEIVGK